MRTIVTLMFLVLVSDGGARSVIDRAPLVFPSTMSAGARVNQTRELPRVVSFRETKERGLLVKVWINERGPYTFAVDTGAGISLISERIATTAALDTNGPQVSFGGLSGVASSSGTNTTVRSMAIGDRANSLRSNQQAVLVNNLPRDIDGILDPTNAYLPFGYSIDLPNRELAAFDPQKQPLTMSVEPEGGTVVKWIAKGNSRRPFVRLGDGRLALLDTGSGLGLAVSREAAHVGRTQRPVVHDLGGGQVSAERVSPSTITIGSMTLRGIPTDLLSGAEAGAPILLGRAALYPFRLIFDPVQQLIAIAPVDR